MGRFDVAARLAEGRSAVEHTQNYVWACHLLGYQHPDLTAHGSQLHEWYDSEDGLDLCALDDDCANLWAAVRAIEEALALQRAQLACLAAAWNGAGADAAMESIQRHCNSGHTVATGIRAAAEGCAALRDDLWQMIDTKVAAAVDIDDRRLTERAAWLSAAQLVTSGAGEQPGVREMVDQQVKPYVDNDIRTDWLTAMRSTLAAADASYHDVIDALTAVPAARFEACGPPLSGEPIVPMASAPVEPAAAAAQAPPANTMPAAAATPVPPIPPSLPADLLDGLPPAPPVSALDAPFGDAAGLSSGAGGLGGLSGGGGLGGLVGLASGIIDAIGGLVGSLTGGLAHPSGLDELLAADDPLGDGSEADDPVAGEKETDDDTADASGPEADQQDAGAGAATGEGGEDSTPEPADAIPPPAPDGGDPPTAQHDAAPPVEAPAAAPAPAGPPPPPDPQAEGSTPCEIAADALPQAGQ